MCWTILSQEQETRWEKLLICPINMPLVLSVATHREHGYEQYGTILDHSKGDGGEGDVGL